MPDGLICEATTKGHVLLQRQELQRRVLQGVPVGLLGNALALEQAADDVDRVVLAVALVHRVDAERSGRRTAARPGPEPKIARPPVMWSSCTMRCATL
jgi:hypothetical protein